MAKPVYVQARRRSPTCLGHVRSGRAEESFVCGRGRDRFFQLDEQHVRGSVARIATTMGLSIEPTNLPLFQGHVPALSARPDQPSVTVGQRDHDAVGVLVWACLIARLVAIFEHPHTRVLEHDLVLVRIGMSWIAHWLFSLRT